MATYAVPNFLSLEPDRDPGLGRETKLYLPIKEESDMNDIDNLVCYVFGCLPSDSSRGCERCGKDGNPLFQWQAITQSLSIPRGAALAQQEDRARGLGLASGLGSVLGTVASATTSKYTWLNATLT